jgi:hypothetical protein
VPALLVDRELIQPLTLPEQPKNPTNEDRDMMWQKMARAINEDNARKAELLKQIDR